MREPLSALALGVLLLPATACRLPEPRPLRDHGPLRHTGGDRFAGLQLAIAPVRLAPSPELPAAANEKRLDADPEEVARALQEAFTFLGGKEPLVIAPAAVAAPEGADDDEGSRLDRSCREAAREGAQVLLAVDVVDYRIAWRGAYRSSLMSHLATLIPILWPLDLIRDELYSASYRIRCRYFVVERQALLAEGSASGYSELLLNDFDRGWSFLPPFLYIDVLEGEGVPEGGWTRLGSFFPWEGHVEQVESACEPHARRALQASFAEHLKETLEPRVGAPQFRRLLASRRAVVAGVDSARRKYASRDAAAVHAWVTSPPPYGAGLPAANVRLLRNEEATRDGILQAVAAVSGRSAAGARGEDRVVVFLAGEGRAVSRDGGTPDLLFLPYGVETAEEPGACIDLRAHLRQGLVGAARESVLILDASFGPLGRDGPEPRQVEAALRELAAGSPEGPLGVWIAAAPGAPQRELESCSHGLFTHLLLQALGGAADANQDRRIDSGEVEGYVRRHYQPHADPAGGLEPAPLFLPQGETRALLGLEDLDLAALPRREG